MDLLDPHQRPPDSIRAVYKKYQKMKSHELDRDPDIIDLPQTDQDLPPSNSRIRLVREIQREELNTAFQALTGGDQGAPSDKDSQQHQQQQQQQITSSMLVYEHQDMPGLHILPSLLPPHVQPLLLSHLLHTALVHPSHLTNLHTHYTLHYPDPPASSFFSLPPTCPSPIATPLDPTVHPPLPIASLLSSKLRWITLGGQYNWTLKSYPATPSPPPFPPAVAALLAPLFPETRADAAIVNLYSPSNTLGLHRDVAERSARGLVGVSLGCDGVFVVGAEGKAGGESDKVLTLRLRSGSAVYMSGDARFAWHGVPQIVAGTCPDYLAEWPASGAVGEKEGDAGEYEAWRGWMKGKRVNLNVRQMSD